MMKHAPITAKRLAEIWGCECVYCGDKAVTIDHLSPQSRGGGHGLSNLVPCCKTCNSSKCDRAVEEFVGEIRAAELRQVAQEKAWQAPGYVYKDKNFGCIPRSEYMLRLMTQLWETTPSLRGNPTRTIERALEALLKQRSKQ